jgi:hypothetical protein
MEKHTDQDKIDKAETLAHNCYDKARALEDSLRAIGKEDEPDKISVSTFFGLSRIAHELANDIDEIETFLERLPRGKKEK